MLIFAILVFVAAVAFVGWRLYRTNMRVPASAEKRLGARDALRFALDNGVPLERKPHQDILDGQAARLAEWKATH